MQVDPFYKYYDNQANIAVGNSTWDQWDSSWTWLNEDECFTEEIDAPMWSLKDREMLDNLHVLAKEYLVWIEAEDDDEYCLAKPASLETLQVFDNNPAGGGVIYSTDGFDNEKLSNFSDIWTLRVSWN